MALNEINCCLSNDSVRFLSESIAEGKNRAGISSVPISRRKSDIAYLSNYVVIVTAQAQSSRGTEAQSLRWSLLMYFVPDQLLVIKCFDSEEETLVLHGLLNNRGRTALPGGALWLCTQPFP